MNSPAPESAPPAPTLRPALPLALAASAVIVISFAIMLRFMFAALDDMVERDGAAQMTAASQAVTAALDQAGKFALAQAETMARRADVAAALAAGDRPALSGMSAAIFDYLKAQAGVKIFGYHSADMRYLLRVHKPDRDGDDISGKRPMVLAANKSRRPQVGLEIGVTGLVGVRGITTVQAGERFVGTMEVGMELLPIIERVKTSTNADIAVILSQSLADLPAVDGKPPKDAGEAYGDLFLSASTDNALFGRLLRDKTIQLTRGTEIRDIRIDGVRAGLVIQPLVDFSGRMVGGLVAVKGFAGQQAQVKQTRTDLTVIALCGGILAFVLFAVLTRGHRVRAGVRP